MRSEGQDCGASAALDRACRRRGYDSVSATDCGIPSEQVLRAMKMKKEGVVFAALAALLLSAAWYLWGPSKTPPAQKPLLILSTENFSQFESAFDQASDSARLVLLLSPT